MGNNRLLNINGRLDRNGGELLLKALAVAFNQGYREAKVCSFKKSKKGLVLSSSSVVKEGWTPLPAPLTFSEACPMIEVYLNSKEARDAEMEGWDRDADHDGHNGPGWRVYVEDWGHVDNEWGVICAIKFAYMWYGK